MQILAKCGKDPYGNQLPFLVLVSGLKAAKSVRMAHYPGGY